MPMYALATIPLIRKLKDFVNNVNQTWYADDTSGSGKISKLHKWWDHLITIGTHFGYFAKASKT